MLGVDLYKQPNTPMVVNITKQDEEFFIHNNIKISIEDCGRFYALYADTGYEQSGEPIELVYKTYNTTDCTSTAFSKLRELCEDFLNKLEDNN